MCVGRLLPVTVRPLSPLSEAESGERGDSGKDWPAGLVISWLLVPRDYDMVKMVVPGEPAKGRANGRRDERTMIQDSEWSGGNDSRHDDMADGLCGRARDASVREAGEAVIGGPSQSSPAAAGGLGRPDPAAAGDSGPTAPADGGGDSQPASATADESLPASSSVADRGEGGDIVAGLDYHHPLERWLGRWWVRRLLLFLSRQRPGNARPHLLRALASYGDDNAPIHERVAYWPVHAVIDRLRGGMPRDALQAKLGGHPPTIRGIVATARSVGRYGLTVPQRWEHPLFVVWNFTDRCNLRCRHCYQSSSAEKGEGELPLAKKLQLIDGFDRACVAMVAFAGGEPTLSPHLEPSLRRCQRYGIHISLATHGGLLTPERCKRLAGSGLRYVEVSLDSVDPARHDAFRGVPGMWQRSVAGIRNVVATEGLRAGIAMCVHRENIDEVEDMIRLAIDLGVSCFAHFNFIPVGRGIDMAEEDITPQQREQLLQLLHRWMESREIGIISTAPQLGRVCLGNPDDDGLISCSHAGNAGGTKARVVARYLGGCGAGRTYACLQPNGDVTPCVYMPHYVMGNVLQRDFQEIFQNNPWWGTFCDRESRFGGCKGCSYRYYCGGCRARADAYYGRLDHEDPGCIHNINGWNKLRVSHLGAHAEVPVETR